MTKKNSKPAEKQVRQDRPRAAICLTKSNYQEKAKESVSTDTDQNAANGLQSLNTDLFETPTWMLEKIKSQLPRWAPEELVSELLLYRMTQTKAGGFVRSIFEHPDEEQAMLERILTRPGMNIVWQSIKTACARQSIDFDGFVRQLWHQLTAANAVINQTTKTPSQTREELDEIAQSLRVAVRKIERNRSARILSKRVVHELTAKNLARYLPSTDDPIIDQIRQEAQINEYVLDFSCNDQTQEGRMANALSVACSLSFVDLVTHLIQEIESCAENYKGEVKDLGNPAPVFIRRVRGLFKDSFNQPMSNTVAALLNVALDRDLGDINEELVRKTR